MKKIKMLTKITAAAALLLLALCLMGCSGSSAEQPAEQQGNKDILADGKYTQTELENMLADDSVDEITISGTIPLNRPLEITGEKVINGDGMLVMAGDAMDITAGTRQAGFTAGTSSLSLRKLDAPEVSDDPCMIIVKNGGSLKLAGNVSACGNYACDVILVEGGGTLELSENAVINRGVNAGVINNGTFLLNGGQMQETECYHIINGGELFVADGELTGSGNNAAAIYSTGKTEMTGGTVKNAGLHGIYAAAGELNMSAGVVDACEKDGVFIDENAALKLTSSAVKIKNCLRHGVTNLGYMEVTGGRIMANTESNIQNYGKLLLNGGNISDSKWAGIYNMGECEVHAVQIATNTYCGVINAGTFNMDGGTVYANYGPAQVINRSGVMKLIGEKVNVTAGKSVGICNDMAGDLEVSGIHLADQYAAHIRNWGHAYVHDQVIDNNQLSSAIYNDCEGEFIAKNMTITNSYVHGIYNVNGAKTDITDCTITDCGGRAVQNKGGTVVIKNLTSNKCVGVIVGNDVGIANRIGDVTIDGLKVSNTLGGILSNTCDGNFSADNVQIDSSNKAVFYITKGTMTLKNSRVDYAKNPSGAVVHGVSLDGGGSVKLSNVTINNVTGRAIQNKGGKVTGSGVYIKNSATTAIGNRFSDSNKSKNGTIDLSNVTVSGSKSGDVVNECPGTITIRNSNLGKCEKTNVAVQAGTVNLIDTKLMGVNAPTSYVINIYGGGTVNMTGGLVTGSPYRGVQVGSSVQEGCFNLYSGEISGNGNEATSVYGGGVNVGAKGIFTMKGGEIKNNVGQQGGQLYLATSAVGTLTDGVITGCEPSYADTVRVGGNDSCLQLGDNIKINGGINIHQKSGHIDILSNLKNDFTVTPHAYNSSEHVLTGDAATVRNNASHFSLEDKSSIYEIGDNGYLTAKEGVTAVAKIPSTGELFVSLQDAFDAVPENGKETEIQIIDDIVLTERAVLVGGRKAFITDDGAARTISRNFTSETNNQNMMLYVYEASSLKIGGNAGLTIKGMDESDKTNADHYRVIFRVDAGSTVTIADGAALTGNYADTNGGAALCYGTVNVTGGLVTGNKTSANGGAFQLATGAALNVSGGKISSNNAKTGGAIYAAIGSNVNISGGEISENSTTGAGGALQLAGGAQATVSGGIFSGNIANDSKSNGGAIQLANDAVLTVKGGTFTGNKALYGAAVNVSNAKALISGGTFTDNIAATAGADLSIKHADADVTVTGGKLASNGSSVNITAGGKLNISGSPEISLVTYESTASHINVTGEITSTKAAVIVPAVGSPDGTTVIKGMLSQVPRFELNAEWVTNGYSIEPSGKLKCDKEVTTSAVKLAVDGVGGEKPFESIQAAANALAETASKKGTIKVCEDIVLTGQVSFSGLNVTLTDDGTARTISRNFSSSVANTNRMFEVLNGSTLTVVGNAGLTIKGDTSTDNTYSNRQIFRVGAAAGATDQLILGEKVTLKDNYTTAIGAGVFAYGNVTINGAAITGMTSTNNGGGAIVYGRFVMNSGTFSKNKGAKGGAIQFPNGADVTINGGLFTGNESTTGEGGALNFYKPKDGTKHKISGGTFEGNLSADRGGAVAVNTNANLVVSGGEFKNNTATGNGGAFQVIKTAMLTISGGVISGNSAVYGGGICEAAEGQLTITDGIIKDNISSHVSSGDNVHVSGGCTLNMTGGTISGSSVKGVVVAGGSVANVSGSAVLGNVKYTVATARINITGNLTAETVATILPYGSADEGIELITGASFMAANHGKFKLDSSWSGFTVGSNGMTVYE